MERDKLAVWQNSSDLDCQDLRPRRLGDRIDGEPMEFEWEIFPGFTTFGLLKQIQDFMKEQQCDPVQFKGKIIFMSMFNDSMWEK